MSLMIYFKDEQDRVRVTYRLKMLVRRAIRRTLAYLDFHEDCEISVTFTDNEGIRTLNARYRGLDRATDVLSFPLFDDDGMDAHVEDFGCMLGDVVLSLEKARAQAEEFGHSFEREVVFLTVHSILHLLGYDHETGEEDETDMRRRQSEIVDKLGFSVK